MPLLRAISNNTESTSDSTWQDDMGAGSDQLFFVTSYSDFDKLAHGPRGTEANQCIYVYRFHPTDGSMVLLNKFGDKSEVMNPAFARFHPRLDVVYTCTEDCHDNGQILAYQLGANGSLTKLGQIDAGGTSTCYLTIDKSQSNILAVNYWDSTLAVIPLDQKTGNFAGSIHSLYDPKQGEGMKALAKKLGGVNHSFNDSSTIRARQADPHSHALVLDPYVGTVAYVPDLGKDLIREFYYDRDAAAIQTELNMIPSGLCTSHPDGPRYLEFHPQFNVAYVVNELSSTIAVFSVNRLLLNEISEATERKDSMDRFKGRSTLTLIQSIKTIPSAFSTTMNTCGRICVHQSGRFVIVSNRGHESIAIFRVKSKGAMRGQLQPVGHFHTRGETPRHFQFDSSGQYLIVANQDSDSIAVFAFNLSSGEIKYTGNEYRVPSPNFVCSCPVRDDIVDLPVPLSVQGGIVLLGSDTESDFGESDGSTLEVNKNSNKELQKQLAQALHQVQHLQQRLDSMSRA